MAKSKDPNENDDVTYMGESVDPDLQKKVDSYMELGESETEAGITKTPGETVLTPAEDAGTAPLLPTDELPATIKQPKVKAAKKIAVLHHEDEAVEPAIEPDEEPEIDAEAEPAAAIESEPEVDPALEPEPKGDVADEVEGIDEKVAEESHLLPDEALNNLEPELVSPADEPIDPETVVAPVDAETVAAPEFTEETDYEGKTIADMDSLHLNDPETADAIDEIIASDADVLLGIEDEKKKARAPVSAIPKAKKKRFGNFFKNWFKSPLKRNATIAVLLLAIIAVVVAPSSRYFMLNTAGVRVAVSVKVLDDKTDLPLKNVEFVVDGKSSKTDDEGNASLSGVKLGKQTILIKKPAFAEYTKTVTLGWGSNPLGEFSLTPVGNQYSFILTDFLSGKPVTKGEVAYGEASAKFSEKGEAVLTVPNVDQEEIEIQVSAEDYRAEKVQTKTTKKEQQSLKLVPDKKHVFVSKRSGKFDLYKVDVDGKNEETILSGSGIEREDSLGIAVHPSKNLAAFTSTRENTRNKDGFLLSTLLLIDLQTNEVKKVTQSERIQVIDWIGARLVYVKIAQGSSEANPSRHRLMSYDTDTNTEKELASTNYFNDVLSVNGAIYYSPALYKVNGNVGLYKINADGTNKKTIFQKEVWNLFRTSYDKVSASVGQDWYELNLSNDVLVKVGGAPAVLKSRVYVTGPDGKQSMWIDERDGKTVLVSYDKESKADKVMTAQSGIRNPIRWLDNDHIVYRVANGQETADYVMSLSGGDSKKVKDVTNTSGIDRWYYF